MTTVSHRTGAVRVESKMEAAEALVSQAIALLSRSSEDDYRRLVATFRSVAKTEHQGMIADWISDWVSEGNPGGLFRVGVLKRVSNGA